MIKNYLKAAWRNILRNRATSFINIGGLAVGMAVALLIGLWIYDELSFNTWHTNYHRIAQVKTNADYSGKIRTVESQPMPLTEELRSSYGNDFAYVVKSTQTEQHVLFVAD